MGKSRAALVAAVVAALLAGCAAGTPSPGTASGGGVTTLPAARAQALQAKAIALTEDMERGNYATTLAVADDTLKKAGVDEARLKAGWDQVGALAGTYEGITGAFSAALSAGDVVYVVAKHSAKSLRVLYSFVPGGESLNGLNLNLATDAEIAQASGGSAAPSASASATATGTGAHSVDAPVTVGQYSLPGTLTRPAGAEKRPVVALLLWGSGPQDRDETIGAANNKMFRDLADALAARGLSSLRFDKRTRAVPTAWTATSTLDEEYFADAKAAIALLQARSDLAGYRIVVIGHSQGAMVLPNVLRDNPAVVAGVSLAGSPRSLFDIMYDQNVDAIGALTGKTDAEKQQLIATSRQVMDAAKALTDPAGTVPEALASVMTAPYVVSLNKLDQAQVARQLTVPLLFAQGEADRQVYLKADFDGWKAALAGRPNVTFARYPGLNHLFMKSQGLAAPADYDAPATLDAQVSADIADWIIAHTG